MTEYLKQMSGFNFVSANSLCSKFLDDSLVRGGSADKDKDGLTDSEEVDWNCIDVIMNGKEYTSEDGIVIALPTFEQVLGFSNFYDAETYDRISPYYRNAIGDINLLPIISDPTSKDGDNDGILDIDEKWNGIDERYMNIDPLKEDTIESLYPELKKVSNLNNRTNPIYLEINKNNITIHVNAYFNEDYNKNVDLNLYNGQSIYEGETYKDLIIDGIQKLWSGTYNGTDYDFYKGMTIETEVEISTVDRNTQKCIEFNVKDKQCGVSNCNMGYSWNTGGEKIITMYVSRCEKHINSYNPDCKQYKQNTYSIPAYACIAAHEFGHALGIADAYGNKGVNNGFGLNCECSSTDEVNEKELWYIDDSRIKYTKKAGDLMYDTGGAICNNIEMMLQAFSENHFQYYIQLDNKPLSKAIKTKLIPYYNFKDHEFYYWDNDKKQIILIGDSAEYDKWLEGK